MNARIQELRERRYQNSIVVVWGLTYWFAAILAPDLVGNVGPLVSSISMITMGALVLGNLLIDSRLVWAGLGVFMTSGIVSSWVGFTEWNVPYSPETAALSMTVLNGITAVVAVAKALEE